MQATPRHSMDPIVSAQSNARGVILRYAAGRARGGVGGFMM